MERAGPVVGLERERGAPLALPTLSASDTSECTRAARALAIAATEGSPSSATAAAASPVVADTTAVAQGIEASSPRHWSSATGWERISRTSSRGTIAGPTSE
jgi:hypothetical protein